MWKKIVLGVLGVPTIYFGASTAIIETQIALLPTNEKFVVSDTRVIGYEPINETLVAYAYIAPTPIPTDSSVIDRTNNTVTQRLKSGKRVLTATVGQRYYREDQNSPWYDLAWATTTKSAYELQKTTIIPTAEAADTGFKTTGTVESVGNWTSFTTVRLNTSDNSRALCDNIAECDGSAEVGVISDFAFGTIGTVTGIEISVEALCFTGTSCDVTAGDNITAALSWDNGSSWTSDKTSAEVLSAAEATYTLGGAADTWGRSWTAAEFADGTFQARIGANCLLGECDNPQIHIDLLQIKIYFACAAGETCTDAFTTAGFSSWTAPATVTTALTACWGAGGAGFDGGTAGGGRGGGGGAFASSSVAVTPGNHYSISIGAGGSTSGANGATSTFATTTVVAGGGTGGKDSTTLGGGGGLASASTGTVKSDGGRGGAGLGTDDSGGGGGGAGGSLGAGEVGADATATTGGAGGRGNVTSGGTSGAAGNGAAGGVGGTSALGGGGGGGGDNGTNGGNGGPAGGGGGGGETLFGSGAAGRCEVTYTVPSGGGGGGATIFHQDEFWFD